MSMLGKHHSKETKQRLKEINIGKRNPKFGKPLSDATKQKIREANIGVKSPQWKGNNVSYPALHAWIRKNKIKPKLCECCKIKPPFDIANISGKYKRDINDFRWLCRKCHVISHKIIKNQTL